MSGFGAGQVDWTLLLLTPSRVAGVVERARSSATRPVRFHSWCRLLAFKSALAANLGLSFGTGHVAEMLRRLRVFYAAAGRGLFATKVLAWSIKG